MRRVLGTAACAALMLTTLAATTAWAGQSGGGSQRWAATYHEGAPAYSSAVALSPDGSTVFVTGRSDQGPPSRIATLAYDAASGDERWAATFPRPSDPEFGEGMALAVSPDGSTVFVSGYSSCEHCGAATFEGFSTIAYDASTGNRLWVSRYAAAGGPLAIAVSPDGSAVFVNGGTKGGAGDLTVAYDPQKGNQLWSVETDASQTGGGLAVSPDSSTVYVTASAPNDYVNCAVTGGFETTAYDASNGSPTWSSTYTISTSACGLPTSIGLSPDGSTVFVTGYGGSSHDGLYELGTVAYDSLTGTQLWAVNDDDIRTPSGDIGTSLGVSPDGSKVFVSAEDCPSPCRTSTMTTLAYDAATGARQWAASFDGGGIGLPTDLAVNPDGSSLYVTGQEAMPCFAPCDTTDFAAPLVAYDTATGDEQWATLDPDNYASALAVSPDGLNVYMAGKLTTSASTTSRASVLSSGATCTQTCGFATTSFNTRSGPGTFQESDPPLRYDGWRSFYAGSAVGGAYRASDVPGDVATYQTPRARSFAWLTHVGPHQGKARVTIDGHSQGTVDLYSATSGARAITFDGLAHRVHTVKVKVLGRKNVASRGTWVALDGFSVRVGQGMTEESSAKVHYDSWSGRYRQDASGGSFRRSGSPSARVRFTFKGRTIRWITATGRAYGRARVVIDGKAHTVDLYRPAPSRSRAISYRGLSKGQHTIVVRPLGRKDAAARSTVVVIDAFVVRR